MDTIVFRASFVYNPALSIPAKVTPETFDETTPVVVVELSSNAAGAILGVSKVKGGNRMETTCLESMSVISYPTDMKCRLWLTV